MKTLIQNGLVLIKDGAGWKTDKADILIDGNRIAAVGTGLDAGGGEVIDAAGKMAKASAYDGVLVVGDALHQIAVVRD